MDINTGYAIGYDLNDIQTQISYFELNNDSPESLVSDGENERLGIPTVLCKRSKVNQWSFGTEAVRLINTEGEAEVNKILSLALSQKSISIDGEEFKGLDLLILFVRKSMDLLSVYVPIDQIRRLVFTVPEFDRRMLSVLERVAAAVPIARDRIMFQSYAESVYCYMIHQPTELWDTECVVFDHDEKRMKVYDMKMNHRTEPVVAVIDEAEFEGLGVPDKEVYYEDDSEMGADDVKAEADNEELQVPKRASINEEQAEKLDVQLYDIVHNFLSSRPIRSVFLLGAGFDGEWCKQTIKFLCLGRRVFQGRNMYSKGACYYGMDNISPGELNEKYIFLGKDKLKFNLGIYMDRNDKEEYIALADGGVNWYDISTEVEFMLYKGSKVELIVTPLDGKEARVIEVLLDGLPERPPKTTRLKMKVSFMSGDTLRVEIEDKGFGEIFGSSGQKWEEEFNI
ncbi:MAG: hypothetical protein K6E98_06265 [Lachnospiraceae bacterium]|nr:hypothetical protein [Lachnospiraceae bacterium]